VNPIANKPKALGRPKSSAKRRAILQCASELFLLNGYSHTSMDEVAKTSQVSKQTVYSHFSNKETLYTAVIEQKCEQYQVEAASICLTTSPLADLLDGIAQRFLSLLCDPGVIAMYSVVIGESKNNPEVAQLFYDAGPLHSVKLVAKLLQDHPDSNLDETSSMDVSHDFFNLLKGDFHMRSMLNLHYNDMLADPSYRIKVVHKTLAIIAYVKG